MFVIPTATLAAVMWSPMLTGPASSPREVSIIQCLGTAEIARIRNSTLMRSIYITRELLTTKVPIWTHKHKLSTKQNFDGFSLSLSLSLSLLLTYLFTHSYLQSLSLSFSHLQFNSQSNVQIFSPHCSIFLFLTFAYLRMVCLSFISPLTGTHYFFSTFLSHTT